MSPGRVRLRRTKGWRKPDGVVVVARPSVFGNPFRLGPDGSRAEIVARYRTHLLDDPELLARARAELAGRDLACWCPLDGPCHADVLLELVNHP
ncbi:MAG: DUF4326 domain-containing protein [Pseudonocardia sp.]|uniref:DUF4326 domain-containing protein n=1 Tax=Pseudonocardia sp. TaxID=60912 RepID=UPI001AC494E6|nr:DUF4326 domain-containing protein [Pseudonocardia sp.]MBN9097577.1 DUF4326 domain-containing protein [Pseudonocardia sp.]